MDGRGRRGTRKAGRPPCTACAKRRRRREPTRCWTSRCARSGSASLPSMDFTLLGTAMSIEGLPPSQDPIVATVPALELVKLLEADVVPTGIAIGAKYGWLTNWCGTAGQTWMGNTESTTLSQFWEVVRREAHAELRRSVRGQGNGVLAHVNFSQMFEHEGGGNQPYRPNQYLGRHIVSAIPAHATERLQGLRSSVHSTGVFTSDFSVNEFLLVRKAGFEPIGLCVGTCVYHVGIQYRSWSKNQELDVLSKAMYHARELAMSRMRAEAAAMGADGIVGVKLTIKRLESRQHLLEFIAIGTGVVHGDGHKGFRAHDGGPFTSDLSGQDFWSLLHSGYRPLEMVMGSCVYHVAHRGVLAGIATAIRNVELENFTSAMYEAREIAIERMQVEAAAAKAEGVVGVDLHEGSHGWRRHVIEFFAIGTAVLPLEQEIAPEKIADPIMVLSVND